LEKTLLVLILKRKNTTSLFFDKDIEIVTFNIFIVSQAMIMTLSNHIFPCSTFLRITRGNSTCHKKKNQNENVKRRWIIKMKILKMVRVVDLVKSLKSFFPPPLVMVFLLKRIACDRCGNTLLEGSQYPLCRLLFLWQIF